MTDRLEPQVDPWQLMIEHNQRIQQLERALRNHRDKIEDLISTINAVNAVADQQQKTIMKLLEIQQQQALSFGELLNKSTPTATGQH